MAAPTLLRELVTAPGPSGYETAPAAAWRTAAAEFADVTTDTVGNSIARVAGAGEGPLLAVVGHIDEIGIIVTHIDDDGFLYFTGVGGWDAQVLIGQRIELVTRDGPVVGALGRKAIHLLREEERKKVPELRDLHIDIGAKDGDDARARVRVGDVGVIAAEPVELPNNRLLSRSLDNRVGAFVAYEAARLVAQEGKARGDVVAVAAVQEEVTFAGAHTSAYALEPQLAIAVDVTHATDAPGVEKRDVGHHPLGSGPVLDRGSTISPRLFELLHETAEAEGIPFTVAASARYTGTDADAIHLSRAGIPTAVVSVPLRYMHSPVELVQLDDIDAAARLLAAFAARLDPDTSFER
jgi:putative aminopeptidase FrvX